VAGSFAHGERGEIRAVSAQPCSVESIALRTLVGGRANRDVSSVPLLQTVVPGIRSSAVSVSWPGSMTWSTDFPTAAPRYSCEARRTLANPPC